ncbi:uncharacterized protein LOC119733268 [Patiria miniata]|uniref:Uncharacterized protein n=1 Tax=Patiria miniata TaxID=46514 RepID=A0A914AGY4_PATMI|nr:uncharacterized protein LOC119733268 [Patiria miniata]
MLLLMPKCRESAPLYQDRMSKFSSLKIHQKPVTLAQEEEHMFQLSQLFLYRHTLKGCYQYHKKKSTCLSVVVPTCPLSKFVESLSSCRKRNTCVSGFPALTKKTLLLILECPETAPLCDDIKHQRNYIQGALGLFRMY